MSFQLRWGRQVSKESRGHLQSCWGQLVIDLVPYLNYNIRKESKVTISRLQHVTLKHKTETDVLKDAPV